MTTPREFFEMHDACDEGACFAMRYETMADVWDNCPRPDWLIWIMQKLGQSPDEKDLRLFACWCVRWTPVADGRTVWDLLADERSRQAVVVAEQFARGEVGIDTFAAARAAAMDAARAAAWDAARDAAWDAARAAAWDAAWDAALKFQADHFRTIFPNPFTA